MVTGRDCSRRLVQVGTSTPPPWSPDPAGRPGPAAPAAPAFCLHAQEQKKVWIVQYWIVRETPCLPFLGHSVSLFSHPGIEKRETDCLPFLPPG
jgi:hypothetical protein